MYEELSVRAKCRWGAETGGINHQKRPRRQPTCTTVGPVGPLASGAPLLSQLQTAMKLNTAPSREHEWEREGKQRSGLKEGHSQPRDEAEARNRPLVMLQCTTCAQRLATSTPTPHSTGVSYKQSHLEGMRRCQAQKVSPARRRRRRRWNISIHGGT